MTTLSDLAGYRLRLSSVCHELTLHTEILNKCGLFNGIDSSAIKYRTKIDKIVEAYTQLSELNSNLDMSLQDLIQSLDDHIDEHAKLLEEDSDYTNKFNEFCWPIGLIDPYYTEGQSYLKNIQQELTQFSAWKFPGLQLYPQSKQWIDVMLASEPLYLVSLARQTALDLISEYPQLYQNRVRVYASALSNTIDRSLDFLPQHQFGYVVMWNTPLYLSSTILNEYLTSIYNLLRPGGILVFNFNNCAIPASAKLAENKIFSALTSTAIQKMANSIGFVDTVFHDVALDGLTHTHISWVKLSKPGKLTTIKSHPTLAKIIEK